MEKKFRVLFLCTGNSARSIMAEALLTHLGHGRFEAYSAGSQPVGQVNPLALELLHSVHLDTRNLRSKSWDEFATNDTPPMDFIITVCDNAASEVCPVWPGHPACAHWSFEDPAAAIGTESERREAFHRIFHQIRNRIQLLLALPVESLDKMSLLHEIWMIGRK